MTTLSQKYAKEETRDGIKVNKTYLAPIEQFYIEPGHNIRDIDPAHVENFAEAYTNHPETVPVLFIEVTDKGLKINEGHHRLLGEKLAIERGAGITRLECKDVTGKSEAKKLTLMVTSSQGRNLSPIERCGAYQRYKAWGWTNDEIAKEVGRSVSDVQMHLSLGVLPEGIKQKIKSGMMSYATGVEITRDNGDNAEMVADEAMEHALADGKTKITKAHLQPKFSAKSARRLCELLKDAIPIVQGDHDYLMLPSEVSEEVLTSLQEYKKAIGD